MGFQHNAKIKQLSEISRRIDRVHRKLFEKHAVEAFGIHRSQHMMLMYISRNENLSQRKIAEHFNISPAAVAVTMKKLESNGFVNRNTSEGDCRRNDISISEKGLKVIDDTRHILGALNRYTFKGFSDEEIEKLAELSQRMYDNLLETENVSIEEMKEHWDEAVV